MQVDIVYNVDETLTEIYRFELDGKQIRYVGIDYSRRNDAKDLWGHLWTKHFDKQIKQEMEAVCRKYEDAGIDTTDNFDYYEEIDDINKKYNPVRNKTNNGQSYFSGFYSLGGPNLPKPKLSKEVLRRFIIDKICKDISKYKINLGKDNE